MEQTPPPEGPIETLGRSAKRSGVGLLLATLPALAALIYINTFYAGQSESTQRELIATNALTQRAALITSDHDYLIAQLETALAGVRKGEIESTLRLSVPYALSWQVVPLDDMGVASLQPADYGLESLVLLDRVRQTFSTGETRFEVVRHNDRVSLALVSRYEADDERGVTVVMLSDNLTDRWVSSSSAGSFSLWQSVENTLGNRIAGSDLNLASGTVISIKQTDWLLSFTPSASLVMADLSFHPLIWLVLIGGLLGGLWLCVLEPRKRLEANVKRLLTGADNREPLELDFPELSPLALTLRQLSLNHRLRQKRAVSDPLPQIDEMEEAPSEQPTERIHETQWTISNGSWVTLPPISAADETKALNELARGIASLTLKGASRSFAISSLGDGTARPPKTQISKALLSFGVDIVDLSSAPLPVVHMATHNATTSGAALVVKRDDAGTLWIGALINRVWVASGFWQNVLSASSGNQAVSENGRSVKFSLEQEYCERLAGDIAMADSLQLLIASNDGATLELAREGLESTLCDIVTHQATLDDVSKNIKEWLSDSSSDAGFFIDADNSQLTVFDETGQPLLHDHVLMLIIQDTLARHPGSDILLGPRASRSLPAFITQCGGASTFATSTPQVVQREMQTTGALVAGDSMGAVYITDRWLGSNDPLYSAARIAEIISNAGAKLSEMIDPLPSITMNKIRLLDSPDLHEALFDLLGDESNFPGARITLTEGVRLDFADSGLHLEPIDAHGTASLRFEGDDVECLQRLERLLVDLLARKHPDLELPLS